MPKRVRPRGRSEYSASSWKAIGDQRKRVARREARGDLPDFEQPLTERVQGLVLAWIAEPARAPVARWIEAAKRRAQLRQGAITEPAEWTARHDGERVTIARVDLQAQGGE